MSIMASVVTATGLVTFDVDVGPDGRSLYRITWWNGVRWSAVIYRSFRAAYKTYILISRMI